MSHQTCTVPQPTLDSLSKIRFNHTVDSCLVLKIDKATLEILEDFTQSPLDIEQLADELPESSPRFLIVSFTQKHSDGRTSTPLVGVYYHPKTSPEQLMLYASSVQHLFKNTANVSPVLELVDKDDLSMEWLSRR